MSFYFTGSFISFKILLFIIIQAAQSYPLVMVAQVLYWSLGRHGLRVHITQCRQWACHLPCTCATCILSSTVQWWVAQPWVGEDQSACAMTMQWLHLLWACWAQRQGGLPSPGTLWTQYTCVTATCVHGACPAQRLVQPGAEHINHTNLSTPLLGGVTKVQQYFCASGGRGSLHRHAQTNGEMGELCCVN